MTMTISKFTALAKTQHLYQGQDPENEMKMIIGGVGGQNKESIFRSFAEYMGSAHLAEGTTLIHATVITLILFIIYRPVQRKKSGAVESYVLTAFVASVCLGSCGQVEE